MPWTLFDSQAFADQARGGVNRYFGELIAALGRRGRWQPVVHAGLHYAAAPGGPGIRRIGLSARVPELPHTIRVLQWVNRRTAPRLPGDLPPDQGVCHPTWYDRRMVARFPRLPLVITVHDLVPEVWPQVSSRAQLAGRRALIERAAGIICVSAATRDELVRRFPDAAGRAAVVHLGLPEHVRRPAAAPGSHNLAEAPYVVYVGKRGSYKNFRVLAEASARCDSRLRVVAVGGEPLADDAGGRLVHAPGPSDTQLSGLLAGAAALVSTSRAEGFGLAALEALAVGTPAILSDIPVYREVYGRWASFFPPDDADALAALLDRAAAGDLPPAPRLEDLEQRYSWEAAAEATEAVYAQALETR